MTDIILSGCFGKMGRVITKSVSEREDCKIAAGVDIIEAEADFPVFNSFDSVTVKADVIIDFSNPAALESMLDFAVKNNCGAVIATTGLSEAQINRINEASKIIPIFYSANMSIGVSLITELAKKAAHVLGKDFDIEIVEAHHNQKIDSPSGTALMIADGISQALETKPRYEFDRHSKREKRTADEIGIHSIRGGTIVGEHEIIFAGHDEIIKISHSARSKELFAVGAINAAVFLKGKPSGMYSMKQLVED